MEPKVNYQAEPVCFVGLYETQDIAVQHELGNHRALSGVTVDLDREKTKDVGVGDVLPKDSLLAKMLRPKYAGQQRGKIQLGVSDPLEPEQISILIHAHDLDCDQLSAQVPLSNI